MPYKILQIQSNPVNKHDTLQRVMQYKIYKFIVTL